MIVSSDSLRSAVACIGMVLLCGFGVGLANQPAIPSSSITASASSEFYPPLTAAHFTSDGSGLDGDLHHAHPNGHEMWLSQAGGGGSAANNPASVEGPAWLLYEFNPPRRLERALVWNHNQPNLTNRGLRDIALHWRDQSGAWHFLANETLDEAPGTPDLPPGNEITLNNVAATALLVTALPDTGNFGSDYFGLSAIRFFGSLLPCFPTGEDLHLVSISIDEEYTTAFLPRAEGWLGSDVACGIALDEERILWLFGDTFIGTSTDGKRDGGAAFANSTIGIQDISAGEPGTIEYYWGPGNTSFFPHQPDTPGAFYWPTMGLMLGGELFVFSFSIDSGGGGGFSIPGTTLLRISNPQDDPPDWSVEAIDFGIGDDGLTIHTGLHHKDDHVYFLSRHNRPFVGNVMIMGRMEAAALLAGETGSSMEFHVADGSQWSSNPADASELFRPGVTESSIHYDAELDYYFALTYDVFGPSIYLSWAREITGPWHQSVCLYNVPEHDAVSFPIISYAARIQPDLSQSPGRLLISYATNALGTISPLFTEEGFGIYHPRFIRVEIAPSELSAWKIY